ncbi:unnamed protein product [Bemisia tabaci]|uniref:Dynamin-type G domain-containing protein n=1 Tax=Bemisia tabaci TaxID=7038 RepID=A0A9P0AGB5_BEMTA|nr:PREDICTED: transmembrane GTPase Marf [Bemisia tabaci]CAH0389939.1 unnamed protein product [Bemisia tabaci]
MAAYINRTLMSGDGPAIRGPVLSSDMKYKDCSPLQTFVSAKRKINDIFVEISDFVQETAKYVEAIDRDEKIIHKPEVELVSGYVSKVRAIQDILSRNHMKVVFFGRTSNGKSSVINAMLRDKVLPSGIGHTTNCFLQVEGSDNGESYLVTEASPEKQNVKSVSNLAHALCEEKLNENELVRVFWPRDKCLLLRDDVVLVDSPGIDVTPNLDDWIDKHCLDADVFVLVVNAESTLMVTEKNFFHKVSTKLSKPNIFILNNRWDASASEPEFLEQVRAQHTERAVDFLTKELKVCSAKEAKERIFFVSAKEVLQARLQEQKGQQLHSGALAEGFPTRYLEFQGFEEKFEECISKSAIQTKFHQHSKRGKLVADDVKNVMETVHERAQQQKTELMNKKKEVNDKLNHTEQQVQLITIEMKKKIHHMVEDVEEKVSKALYEEIRRLNVLVDEFNQPFHSDPLVLNVYKKELHSHVESGLDSNLRGRLSTALAMNIDNSQREMTDRMASLLPPQKKQLSMTVLPKREPFEILYRINCDNLCSDFKEDLEFRFSWGIVSLIQRFVGNKDKANAIALQNYNYTPMVSTPPAIQPSNMHSTIPFIDSSMSADDWSVISRLAMLSSIGSQSTMGGLLIGGVLLKTVGWRIILVTGAVYGCLYLYERLTWTNKAKERLFKRQYVDHVSRKLGVIVDLTSANCSHQVQQELVRTFARLCQLVDETTTELRDENNTLTERLEYLETAASATKILRNKAIYVAKELAMFDDAYLGGSQ